MQYQPHEMPKLNREQKKLFKILVKARTAKTSVIDKSIRKLLVARAKIDAMEAAHQLLVRTQNDIYTEAQASALRQGLHPKAVMFLENITPTKMKVIHETQPPQAE